MNSIRHLPPEQVCSSLLPLGKKKFLQVIKTLVFDRISFVATSNEELRCLEVNLFDTSSHF